MVVQLNIEKNFPQLCVKFVMAVSHVLLSLYLFIYIIDVKTSYLANDHDIVTLDLANWMKIKSDSLWNSSLRDLTILGTHDSGAFNLTKYLMPRSQPEWLLIAMAVAEHTGLPVEDIFGDWSITQPSDFSQQLHNGVRYFDLRCGWDSRYNDWFVFHIETGQKISKVIQQIKSFLDVYTNEIVLIESSHLYGNPTQHEILRLINYFIDTFGDLLYDESNLNHPDMYSSNILFPTYGNMIELNQRVFLSLSNDLSKNFSSIWNGDIWYNTYANSDNVRYMMHFNDMQIKRFNNGSISQNELFKVSWTLTPNGDTVLRMMLPNHPHTLLQLAENADKYMWSWVENKVNNSMKIGNVLLFDNFAAVPIGKILNMLYP